MTDAYMPVRTGVRVGGARLVKRRQAGVFLKSLRDDLAMVLETDCR